MWLSQHDVTGQHVLQVKFLAGQVTILAWPGVILNPVMQVEDEL